MTDKAEHTNKLANLSAKHSSNYAWEKRCHCNDESNAKWQSLKQNHTGSPLHMNKQLCKAFAIIQIPRSLVKPIVCLPICLFDCLSVCSSIFTKLEGQGFANWCPSWHQPQLLIGLVIAFDAITNYLTQKDGFIQDFMAGVAPFTSQPAHW